MHLSSISNVIPPSQGVKFQPRKMIQIGQASHLIFGRQLRFPNRETCRCLVGTFVNDCRNPENCCTDNSFRCWTINISVSRAVDTTPQAVFPSSLELFYGSEPL